MRAVLLLPMLLVACSDPPNRQEFTNVELALLQLHERVGQLSAQLGVQPTMPDLVPLTARVAALEAAVAKVQAPKVPHLVVANVGDDLGIYLGEPARAWNVEAGGEVDWSRGDWTLFYKSADCTGDAWSPTEYFVRASYRIIGPKGSLLRPAPGGDTSITARSFFYNDPKSGPTCFPYSNGDPLSVVRVEDTGVAARAYKPALLEIGFR